jgi:radical SAM superfamily enzyme YgiQ (UPF0313 family)
MYAAPLGEAYVASYLQKEGHEVEILDLTLTEDMKKDIPKKIDSFVPDVIGMSIRNIDIATYPATIYFYPFAKQAIEYTKEITDIPIILGGSGFSIFAEQILRDTNHDFGVIGEGEYAFAEVVKRIRENEDIKKIPKGICYLTESGKFVVKEPWRVENLDDIPFPSRDLLQNDKYKLVDGSIIGNLQTHRGCPFNCTFCSYVFLEGHDMRYRSVNKIVDEIDIMVNNHGIDNIFFTDSVLNLNYKHLESVCKEIIRRGIDFNWGCNYRSDINYLELIPLLKESGAKHFAIGVDSLSDKVLKEMKKEHKKSDIIETTNKCSENEIELFLSLMLGAPGDTLDTVKETLDAMLDLNVYMDSNWQGASEVLLMTGIRIYPHTKINEIALKEGIITKNDNLLYPKFYITPDIPENELFDLVKSYCHGRETWNYPGFFMNCPSEMTGLMNEQLQRYGVNEKNWV